MRIRRKVKFIFLDIIESLLLKWRRNSEIRKFKNTRRIQIANQYLLTSEQKKQIDKLYLDNYGEKIDYVWHQNYAAHAGMFDYRFFPELLYIPEFEAFQNQNKAITIVLSDKNFLPIVAKSVNIKTPEIVVSCTNGVLMNHKFQIISEKEALNLLNFAQIDLFVKPTRGTCSGLGCTKIKITDKKDFKFGNLLINNEIKIM